VLPNGDETAGIDADDVARFVLAGQNDAVFGGCEDLPVARVATIREFANQGCWLQDRESSRSFLIKRRLRAEAYVAPGPSSLISVGVRE
jgi:hypothetical protein